MIKEYRIGDIVERLDKSGRWGVTRRYSVNPGGPLTYYDVYELETSYPTETIHLSQIKPVKDRAFTVEDIVMVDNEVGPHRIDGFAPNGEYIVCAIGQSEDFYVKESALRLYPYEVREPVSIREAVLDEAKRIVMKDRNTNYGSPESNLGTIAKFWSEYLHYEITPHDVATMMVLMKVSRIMTSPNQEDHWVDIAGYAAIGAEVRSGLDR